MLTSVVKIQVSRVMSQTYLTIHITTVFAGCTIVCLVCSISEKKWLKIVLFMELFTDLKSAVLEWCMLHNTFHLTFLTMQKFQSFKLIREPYLLELKIVFFKEQFHKITHSILVKFHCMEAKTCYKMENICFHQWFKTNHPKDMIKFAIICSSVLIFW